MTENDDAVLARIRELAADGKLTEHQVVDEAADPSSPFHDEIYAETDEEAAFERRLHLARCLISRFRYQIVEPGGPRYIRENTRVPSLGKYVPTEVAFADHREEMRGRAMTALKSFCRQYRLLGDEELVAMMREVCSA